MTLRVSGLGGPPHDRNQQAVAVLVLDRAAARFAPRVMGQFEVRPRLFGDVVFVDDIRGTLRTVGLSEGDLTGGPPGFLTMSLPLLVLLQEPNDFLTQPHAICDASFHRGRHLDAVDERGRSRYT
jgi:hypothetical protein